jgi:hypothetical protein
MIQLSKEAAMARKKAINVTKASESKMVNALDDMAEFEQYRTEVLPMLRKAVKEKWSVEKIYNHFGSMIAAKVITVALTEKDTGKALSAAKEALDRGLGKPKERLETTHKYEKLSDEELDSLLSATLQSVEGDSDHEPKH